MTQPKKEISDKIRYPEPDRVLTQKPSIVKYLRYLLFFGPGAVLVSMTVGQGQLIIGPQIGAWAGYSLLWIVSINIGSYILGYISCRFLMISGLSLMDIFAIKTRKGWFNWVLIIIMAVFIPVFAATIIITLGHSVQWIVGGGEPIIWGVMCCLIAALFILAGRYRFLEVTQAFFVAVLSIGAIISVFMIEPDILNIIPNFFNVGYFPQYPAWVDSVEGFTKTPIPILMLGYLGTLTITMIPVVGYIGWIKLKKWGIFRNQKDPNKFSHSLLEKYVKKDKIDYLPDDKGEVKKSRILLKPLKVDLGLAFILVSIISAAYVIAGAKLLGPRHIIPSDLNLIRTQAVIFTEIAPWLEPLFKVSVFFAFFGTMYAGFEAASRMLYETGRSISKKVENMQYVNFIRILIVLILGVGIPLAIIMSFFGLSFFLVLSLTLMFLGVISVVIYGAGALYITQTVLPEKYRLHPIIVGLAVLSLLLLCLPLLGFFV